MFYQPLIEGGNIDIYYCHTLSEHLRSASQVPVVLCFSFACRSLLFTSSNPLKLSLPLSVCPIVRPSLTLLVCGGSSFHSSCLPTSPLPSPYHFLIPTFSTVPPVSPCPSFSLSHFISSCCLYSYSTCHYLLI